MEVKTSHAFIYKELEEDWKLWQIQNKEILTEILDNIIFSCVKMEYEGINKIQWLKELYKPFNVKPYKITLPLSVESLKYIDLICHHSGISKKDYLSLVVYAFTKYVSLYELEKNKPIGIRSEEAWMPPFTILTAEERDLLITDDKERNAQNLNIIFKANAY